MARPRKRRRRRSRGGGRFLSLYLVLAVVVTAVVIGAGCIVFFKVNQFEVEGNQRYSTEEIAKASGVSKGDNLFLVNKTETARKLLDELAYVRSVNIKRKLPDTLVITVARRTPPPPSNPERSGGWSTRRARCWTPPKNPRNLSKSPAWSWCPQRRDRA